MKRLAPRILLFAGCLGLALVFGASSSSAAQSRQGPDPRFGLVESFWNEAAAADLGVGWDRILFYWRDIQPTGPDDWNTLHVREEWLAQANASGRTVVGLLKNTAPWASEDGSDAGLPRGLFLPVDDPDNLWASFVRKVAQYYARRNVHHWIIWNEPEIDPGVYGYEFAGSVQDYYQLLKVAYLVMKQTDPEAVIHLAGVTWWHDQGFLDRLLRTASQDPEASAHGYFFDVFSLHVYFRSETVATIIQEVEALQGAYGLNKPIWLNETNAPPDRDPLWPVQRPQFPVDALQQAWFIQQAAALAFASGAERIAVYKLLDIHLPEGGESYGLLRPDGSRRPAYYAYQAVIDNWSGFNRVSHDKQPGYHLVTFERQDGLTRVFWARQAAGMQLDFPSLAPEALFVDAVGRTSKLRPRDGRYQLSLEGAICQPECLIGGPPVMIVESGEPQVMLTILQDSLASLPPEGELASASLPATDSEAYRRTQLPIQLFATQASQLGALTTPMPADNQATAAGSAVAEATPTGAPPFTPAVQPTASPAGLAPAPTEQYAPKPIPIGLLLAFGAGLGLVAIILRAVLSRRS